MDLVSGEIIFMSTLSQKIQVNILVLNLGDASLPVQFCVSMLCAQCKVNNAKFPPLFFSFLGYMQTSFLGKHYIFWAQHRNLDIFAQVNILNLVKVSWCDLHSCDWITVVRFCFSGRLHHCLFKTSWWKVTVSAAQLCSALWNPLNCSAPDSSVHRILQARILEWVAIPISRGSFWPRDQTWVSNISGRFFTIWATREVLRLRWNKPNLCLKWCLF